MIGGRICYLSACLFFHQFFFDHLDHRAAENDSNLSSKLPGAIEIFSIEESRTCQFPTRSPQADLPICLPFWWGRKVNHLRAGRFQTPPFGKLLVTDAVKNRVCMEKHKMGESLILPSFFSVVVLDELKQMITEIQHFEVIK